MDLFSTLRLYQTSKELSNAKYASTHSPSHTRTSCFLLPTYPFVLSFNYILSCANTPSYLVPRPPSLSPCGHILCLHCLQDWFRAAPIDPSDQMEIDSETDEPLPLTQRRKTCPCCRARVKERPVRSFVVRGLVEVIKKAKSAKEAQAAAASARAAASAGMGESANVVRDSSPPPEMEGDDPWEGIFEEPYSSEEESGDDDDDDEDEDEDGSDIEEDENDMEMVTSEDDERAMGTGMAEDDDEEDDDDDDGAEMTDGANMDESGTGRRVTVFEWFASRAGRGRGNLNGNANEDANASADQGESDEEDGASVYVSGSEGGAAVGSDEHEHSGSGMDDGEGQNQDDNDSDDDSSTYSNSSDEDYPGPWISPSWEPPLHHPSSTLITSQLPHSHPHPHSPHLTQQIQLLSRGVTNEMLRLYPGRWRYTHEEGIVMREFGVEIWLGWNLRLRENEGEGVDEEGSGAERFFRRIWEEMYEGRPERWRREPIPNPPTPPLNTHSLGRRGGRRGGAVGGRLSEGGGVGPVTERVVRLIRADREVEYESSDSEADYGQDQEDMDQ